MLNQNEPRWAKKAKDNKKLDVLVMLEKEEGPKRERTDDQEDWMKMNK